MKKYLLIIISLIFNLLPVGENTRGVSQNGFAAYLNGPVLGGWLSGPETGILIDNAGNKWVRFTSSLANSPAAVAKYFNAGGYWVYYNTANTPAFLSNRVLSMAKDNFGNIYFGTLKGLVKYNGTVFTSYTMADGLPSDNIIALECVNNMLYIGTPGGGLTRFDGTLFYDYNKTNGLLGNDTVNCIIAETTNKLWLGINNRIVQFNINAAFTVSSYTNYSVPNSPGKINCIYIDGSNNKWLGTNLKGIVMYDNTNFTSVSNTYSNSISNTSYTNSPLIGGASFPVNCLDITRGPNNGALISTYCSPYVGWGNTANVNTCLLELLPNAKYKTYYPPNFNYSLGSSVEMDASGQLFISNSQLVHLGGFLKFMFSFNANAYNGFLQGTGFGVTEDNYKFLDINRVKAGMTSRGDMFWDIGGNGNASYEVPKGSKVHSAFAASLWMGGLDASNQLHTACNSYRQTGSDFWCGPLDTINAAIDTANVMAYDKIWKVNYIDIDSFIVNFNNGNIAANTYTPTQDIITWPAKGVGKYTRNMAPFIDVNNNGIYDPLTGGDYPQIKGDETLYYIINDNFTPHTETGGLPFGVEVHVMAYAYGCNTILNGRNELQYSTFYDYKIINRSNNNYHDMYLGFWTDADLGNYIDDLIACRVQDNFGFLYNGDGTDENYTGTNGYGNYPPAAGAAILKGPLAPIYDGLDNNNNGVTDEPGEQCLMNKFLFYNLNVMTNPLVITQPTVASNYYTYLKGLWKDSTSFTCGGKCYGGTTPTSFVYPWSTYNGNPCALWADGAVGGNPKGDRRFILSSGPFNLNAKQSTEAEYAYVWAVDSTLPNNQVASAIKLISDQQKVRAFYNSTTQSACLPNMSIGIKEENNFSSKFILYPNPANSVLNIKTDNSFSGAVSIEMTDIFGKRIYKKQSDNLNSLSIDVHELSGGIYFVTFSSNGKQAVKKFVKH